MELMLITKTTEIYEQTMILMILLVTSSSAKRHMYYTENVLPQTMHTSLPETGLKLDDQIRDIKTSTLVEADKTGSETDIISGTAFDSIFKSLSQNDFKPLQNKHTRVESESRKGNKWHHQRFNTKIQDGKTHQNKRRHRRHNRKNSERKPRHGLKRRSCQTLSSYVFKSEAEDIFGNTVKIYPFVHVGKLSINQYFYESFCDVEKCKCSGIDTEKYKSSCETDYSYTYARVIKGEELGWTHVKVRSGCSCVIRERHRTPGRISIMDLI